MRGRVLAAAECYLGRPVRSALEVGEVSIVGEDARAKIDELELLGRRVRHANVGRLDVAVRDAERVQECERAQHLPARRRGTVANQ